MPPGIYPKQLGAYTTQYGGVPFCIPATTVSGTASYTIPDSNGFVGVTPFVVIRVDGVMTGAGAVGDTVQLTDDAGNAITEAIDLSALTTNDMFTAAVVNTTNGAIGLNEHLHVVTASDATCALVIWCLRST